MSGFVGALQAQNNLSEIAAAGAAAQRSSRFNLSVITAPGFNPVDYGADPTGVADCSSAFAAAAAAAATSIGACIQFPVGTFYFAAPITLSIAAGTALSIFGAGSQATVLKFAAGINGIVLNYQAYTAGAHIRNMTIATAGGFSTTQGITLNQQSSVYGLGPISDISDVTLRGADGITVSDYWGTGILCSGVSQVNLNGLYIVGPAPDSSGYITSDLCYGVRLVATSSLPAVEFNLNSCILNYLGVAVDYGAYVQGVTLTGCNITGGYRGVMSPASDIQTDQLCIVSSQFNVYLVAVNSSVPDLLMSSNLIFVSPNGVGVQVTDTQRVSLVGNSIISIGTSTNGIVVISYGGGASVITGNHLLNHLTGIWLQSGSQYVNVQSNGYSGNGTNVLNQGSNNTIGGGSP